MKDFLGVSPFPQSWQLFYPCQVYAS